MADNGFDLEKQIKKGDDIVVRYCNKRGETVFLLTRDYTQTVYTMFSVESGKIKKLGKGGNPLELEKKYNISGLIMQA